MTSAPYEPLSPEERELAQRLARLGAPGGPPPSLDAQILAAAHAGLADKSSRPSRRPRRWPLALGAVATLALAVGIAWQLRPRPDSVQAYSEAPATASVRTRQSGPSATEELPAAEPAVADAPEADFARAIEPPPLPPPAPAAAPMAKPKPTVSARPALEAEEAQAFPQAPERREARPAAQVAPSPPAPPPPRADIVFDQSAAAEAEAAPPTPAPMPATGADASAGSARGRRASSGEAKQLRPASDALDQIIVMGTRTEGADEEHEAGRAEARDNAGYSDQEIDDQPPATADSPLVQKAWLQRIRELVADGKQDEASNSLAEFKRRYPRYALPEDLQELLP